MQDQAEVVTVAKKEKKERLPRGAVKRILEAFCNQYTEKHGRWPLHKEVLEGTGLTAVSMSDAWNEWRADQRAGSAGMAPVPAVGPATPVVVPDSIANAWSTTVAAIEGELRVELEATKLSIRHEVDEALAGKAAAEEEKTAMAIDGRRLELELEQTEIDAAEAAAASQATIEARDVTIAGLQTEMARIKSELAVKVAELAGTQVALGKAETALITAQEGERAARTAKESTLELLAAEQIKNTKLADEVIAGVTARITAEDEAKASARALSEAKQKLAEMAIDLAEAKAAATERQVQIQAGEIRASNERTRYDGLLAETREHGEKLAEAARERGEKVAEELRKEVAQMKDALMTAKQVVPVGKE